jgi:hypothetical protein
LGDLVGVVRRGQPGPDVQELAFHLNRTAFTVSPVAPITAAIAYTSSVGQTCTATGGFMLRVL